ncbi:MAG: TetR/AcrR family transcriptional regulator [Myxococcaceae bacterium]|nr:TetR/AcrR family transcriptional regulator [Myxococcaceae bacterium]
MPPTPTQILDAATGLFAQVGFDGSSLQDIAKAAGVQKPTLLYHFVSKDEIRTRVLERILEHWNDAVPRLMQAAAKGGGRFDAVLDEVVAFFAASPNRARLLLREVLDRPAEMRALVASHVRPWLTLIGDDIRHGQAAGVLRRDLEPELYCYQVMVTVLAAVASLEVLPGVVAEKKPRRLEERFLSEVKRAAKAALFPVEAPRG